MFSPENSAPVLFCPPKRTPAHPGKVDDVQRRNPQSNAAPPAADKMPPISKTVNSNPPARIGRVNNL
jgi:hypothetical protein